MQTRIACARRASYAPPAIEGKRTQKKTVPSVRAKRQTDSALATAVAALFLAGLTLVATAVFTVHLPPKAEAERGAPGVAGESDTTQLPEIGSDSDVREVTVNVSARANVPSDLVDRYWYAPDLPVPQAGQLGTTARILLASGETPIAAQAGLVAVVSNGERFARQRASTIRIWDVHSGHLVAEATTHVWVEHGVFAGGFLFWTGLDINQAPEGAPELYPGSGVWALAGVERAEPINVVPPEATAKPSTREPLGQGTRGPFAVSVSGRTITSPVYLDEGRVGRTDVIAVEKLALRSSLPTYVCATSDSLGIACPGDGRLVGISLSDGVDRWHTDLAAGTQNEGAIAFIAAVEAYEKTAIVEFSFDNRLFHSSVDLETGKAQNVLIQGEGGQPGPFMFLGRRLSSESHLVLLPEVSLSAALELAEGTLLASMVDMTTGSTTVDAFTIGAP